MMICLLPQDWEGKATAAGAGKKTISHQNYIFWKSLLINVDQIEVE